ncbi:MAG: hypothetical protein JW904_12890 [Spirochaetales bacterium]|nr:hypothetical protein [Spirochaetales bacterium]
MSENTKPLCFVIQHFDNGPYDRRYIETIKPALLKANVDPQRADDILGLNPIIEKIESNIRSAAICIAEVSEDNPNVWLELGYALALFRPTVILCDKAKRSRLPFDIQHRPVIYYRTDSRSGYDELEKNIIKWTKNELKDYSRMSSVQTLKPETEQQSDLKDYEVAILSTAFAYWTTMDGGISQYQLKQKMLSLNFNDIAVALGVTALEEKGFLATKILTDTEYNNEEYKAYVVTKNGIQWIQNNKNLLSFHNESKTKEPDGIPF